MNWKDGWRGDKVSWLGSWSSDDVEPVEALMVEGRVRWQFRGRRSGWRRG
jgi:hypothetical protein